MTRPSSATYAAGPMCTPLFLVFCFVLVWFGLFFVFCLVVCLVGLVWFFETEFLCSPGCPGTHFVDQSGLELRNSPVSASIINSYVSLKAPFKGSFVQLWLCSL